MAVQLGSTAGTGSLELGLRSFNFANGRSLSTDVSLRTRLGSSNPRKLVVRAEEKSVVDLRGVTGIKRGVPSSSEHVLISPKRQEEDDHEERKRRWAARQAAKAQKSALQLDERLSLAARKIKYAEKELAKLDGQMKLSDDPSVKEQITDEERYMFMKLGLRMRARLLMGRRGVFDGVVENMHLHWKHRELVKVIFKGSMFEAEQTAKILEVESGGVFVGIVTTTKGQAIIFYRGKNYQRPSELRPRHLLSKRQAYERSLEMQRKRSLEQHILKLEKEIGKLQLGLYGIGEGNSNLEMEEKNLLALSEPLGTDLEDFDDEEFYSDENHNKNLADDMERSGWNREKPNPRGVLLDPIFKAQPLTIKERIRLRQEALKQSDPMHINIGKSNMVAGLAKAIRLYFQKQPFAIVGVKGRAKDTPVEEIIEQLEDATGAVLVSREPNKLILYRGWPAGEQRPDMVSENEEEEEEIPPELRAAIMMEEVLNPMDYSYLTREELSLIGIEYKGNGIEENDREENPLEQEGEGEGDDRSATWNDERCHTEDDNGATEADMWDEEKWYTEDEDDDNENDAEAKNLELKLGGVEKY